MGSGMGMCCLQTEIGAIEGRPEITLDSRGKEDRIFARMSHICFSLIIAEMGGSVWNVSRYAGRDRSQGW